MTGHTQLCSIDPFAPDFEKKESVNGLCSMAMSIWSGWVIDVSGEDDADPGPNSEIITKYGHMPETVFDLLRWVILVYDPRSPLVKDYPDLPTRKFRALVAIGIDEKESDWDWLILNRDKGVTTMITAYMRNYCKSRLWAMIVANNEAFWEFFSTMIERNQEGADDMNGVNAKIKTSDGMVSLLEKIDKQMNDFYGEDKETIAEGDEMFMSVEKMADVLSNRKR
jgi:hypothetical protein